MGHWLQLSDRLIQSTMSATGSSAFLQSQLPEIATEFSAQWVAVVQRTPAWQVVSECGRQALKTLPYRFLEETLDREAGGMLGLDDPPGWSIVAVPLPSPTADRCVLALAGRSIDRNELPLAMATGRTLGYCLHLCRRVERDAQRISRLERLSQVASTFAGTCETIPLLESIAEAATQLLDCDRSSIFIWDREHHQLVACPALGVKGGTLRLPDDAGIVGETIQTSHTIRVDDAYSDPRFNKSVDRASGYKTRNLLCVPMRDTQQRLIGAFEVINKRHGGFTDEDDEMLKQLGVHAAVALKNARERDQLVRSRQQLTAQVTQGVCIIGESPAIVALRNMLDRLAATDLPVLILGESGTGKEVVSQALHFQGPRADKPFVAVNCAALTETLLESELFGHEKGAFTDARETKPGKFELADGGAIFLDEIGDMSPGGQAKLLRVLEQKVVTRVGGTQTIPIDVRVIAATNTNLAAAVREKRFRQDLFFRVSVVTLDLPPLRERPEDILLLAEFFLKQFSVQAGRPVLELSAEARRRLQSHHWPGNVRELRNLMERVAFLCPSQRVKAEDLAFILGPDRESSIELATDLGLAEATKQFQQEYIRRTIKRARDNMSEAAKLLGLHRSNLYRKMRLLAMKEAEDADET